jgi:hypothetical protein
MSDFAKNAARRYPSHARKRSPTVTQESLDTFDEIVASRGYASRSAALSAVAMATLDHGIPRGGVRDRRFSVTLSDEACRRLSDSLVSDETSLTEALELAVALHRLGALDALLGEADET